MVVFSCEAHLPEVDEELIEQHRCVFGHTLSLKAKESLVSYLTRFDRDIVLYALELAGYKGKGFDYAQGVFENWQEHGAFTFDDVFAYDEQYREQCSK